MCLLTSFQDVLRRDVLTAAPQLLGWRLVRGDLQAQIVEVEAYRSDEPASHSFGKTKMKNMAMFGPAGNAYIYFNYGVHWMLNLVAHEEGNAAAILIRAAQPLQGLETFRERRPKAVKDEDLLSGPGKLASAFNIDPRDNGLPLLESSEDADKLYLLPPDSPVENVVAGPRVGIAIGKAHDLPWRFIDANRMKWASRPWIK